MTQLLQKQRRLIVLIQEQLAKILSLFMVFISYLDTGKIKNQPLGVTLFYLIACHSYWQSFKKYYPKDSILLTQHLSKIIPKSTAQGLNSKILENIEQKVIELFEEIKFKENI
ncbi:MAG: hypothetical protein ABIK61_05640 [candidate division WOR-3 bacterium]